jgi:hypothetical protein
MDPSWVWHSTADSEKVMKPPAVGRTADGTIHVPPGTLQRGN